MRFFTALCLAFLPTTAAADISSDIADLGLSGARAQIEAQASRSVDDQFALGGILFLEAVERVAADPVRGRVGRDEGRKARFERLERTEEAVVLRVGDERRVLLVVADGMRADERPQRLR